MSPFASVVFLSLLALLAVFFSFFFPLLFCFEYSLFLFQSCFPALGGRMAERGFVYLFLYVPTLFIN